MYKHTCVMFILSCIVCFIVIYINLFAFMCEYLCTCDAIGVFTDYIEYSAPVNLEASSIFSYLDEYSNVVNEF